MSNTRCPGWLGHCCASDLHSEECARIWSECAKNKLQTPQGRLSPTHLLSLGSSACGESQFCTSPRTVVVFCSITPSFYLVVILALTICFTVCHTQTWREDGCHTNQTEHVYLVQAWAVLKIQIQTRRWVELNNGALSHFIAMGVMWFLTLLYVQDWTEEPWK